MREEPKETRKDVGSAGEFGRTPKAAGATDTQEKPKEEPTKEYEPEGYLNSDTMKRIRERLNDRKLPRKSDIEELLKYPDIDPNTPLSYIFKNDKGYMNMDKGVGMMKLRSILNKRDQLRDQFSQKNLLRQLTLLSK